MAGPSHLSLYEIREFMLKKGGKVTNHELVKHFKKFLTNPDTQSEARKQFKTYVNVLSTIKNEGKEKYLILRKKYVNECPVEEDNLSSLNQSMDFPMSPGSRSTISEADSGSICAGMGASISHTTSSSSISSSGGGGGGTMMDKESSPYREPPPYKPPPEVSPSPSTTRPITKLNVLEPETKEHYKECVDEFKTALNVFHGRRGGGDIDSNKAVEQNNKLNDQNDVELRNVQKLDEEPPIVPPRKRTSTEKSISRESSIKDDNKENENLMVISCNNNYNYNDQRISTGTLEKQMSVKEATQKFNKIAAEEEEAKITSPSSVKQKSEKKTADMTNDNLFLTHPKAKEWLVLAANARFHELFKLASDYPELVKFQDPTTTALHWAAKHGNEDVVKLIAGTHKINVNSRTGYTPLHLAMQFGKQNIFELLCNVYKADRDMLDWSGKKPLDYLKQRTSVSASTYSKIKARKKNSEKDLGFLRIGSLNVRVKKTTEAFSNFLGVGSNNNHHSQNYNNNLANRMPNNVRASAPPTSTYFEKIHKNWGSADNIPRTKTIDSSGMLPPKQGAIKSRRQKRTIDNNLDGCRSVPTTPSQPRANNIETLSEHPQGESDSDSACGFDSNWQEQDESKKPTFI